MGGRTSRKESLAALASAWEAGITLYDTARSYGYGQSEGLLGEFFRGKRDSVVLCTKFGILPTHTRGWKQRLKPLARGVLHACPGLRAAVRRQLGDQFLAGQFTVAAMESSLEVSLRELKTDYVDLLLLHAAPAEVLEQDDLLAAMERLVSAGKVRLAGISADSSVIELYFKQRPRGLDTAQFSLNISNMQFAETTKDNDDLLLVANHPYGGPSGIGRTKAIVAQLRDSTGLTAELREKLDPRDPQLLPELVLNCILDGTGVDAVVPAMMQKKHLEANVRALESCRFSAPDLALIRSRLAQKPERSS